MCKKIHNPHDLFFKSSMERKRVVQECVTAHFDKSFVEQINFESLTLAPTNLVGKELDERRSDVLFSVEINGHDGFVYFLFEHQSTSDKWMPLRHLDYMLRIWERYRKAYESAIDLPVIIPIVFYNGVYQYRASTDLLALFGDNKTLAQEILFQPFKLIDLTQISPEELSQFTWYQLMACVMKFVWDETKLFESLENMSSSIEVIEQGDGGDYIYVVLKYIAEAANVQDAKRFKAVVRDLLTEKTGEDVMTLADIFREEGKKEGMQQGMQQGIQRRTMTIARDMLGEGVERDFILRMTGISDTQLCALERELEAETE